jgi:hypothetical protein
MPQLTFPTQLDGLYVDVYVNLPARSLLPLRQSGQPAPPISARGYIDTGSDISAVALPLLQRLGLPPGPQTTTRGVSGPAQVTLYRVSLHILHFHNVTGPWFSHPNLQVMDLPGGLPFDVLIGLDIILTCRWYIDGPGGLFTIDF